MTHASCFAASLHTSGFMRHTIAAALAPRVGGPLIGGLMDFICWTCLTFCIISSSLGIVDIEGFGETSIFHVTTIGRTHLATDSGILHSPLGSMKITGLL